MFSNLIESKPRKQRSTGGTIFSVILHAILGALVVVVTANAGQKLKEKPRQEEVKFIDVKPKEPPPPEPEKPPPPPEVVAAPPPPKGFQVLAAPIKIPDKLPDIDLSKKVTDEADFSGKGVAGGTHNGVVGGKPVNADQTYFSFQVEKQVLPRDDNPKPKYPSILESSGQPGEVLIQFVVDTTGRIDMGTVKVLKATNDLFASAVKAVLPQWRFLPAEAGGRKVKQLAQLPLTFQPPK